jgi:hypothetical protein
MSRVVLSFFSRLQSDIDPVESLAGRLSLLAYWPPSRAGVALTYFKYNVWLEAAQLANVDRVLACIFQSERKSATKQS